MKHPASFQQMVKHRNPSTMHIPPRPVRHFRSRIRHTAAHERVSPLSAHRRRIGPRQKAPSARLRNIGKVARSRAYYPGTAAALDRYPINSHRECLYCINVPGPASARAAG